MKKRIAPLIDLLIAIGVFNLYSTPHLANNAFESFLYFHTKSISFVFVINLLTRFLLSSTTGRTLGERILGIKENKESACGWLKAYRLEIILTLILFFVETLPLSLFAIRFWGFEGLYESTIGIQIKSAFFVLFAGIPAMIIYLIFSSPRTPKNSNQADLSTTSSGAALRDSL